MVMCTGETRVLPHALAGGLGPIICGYSHRPIRGSGSMHACMRTHAHSRAYACACKISLPPLLRCCDLCRGHCSVLFCAYTCDPRIIPPCFKCRIPLFQVGLALRPTTYRLQSRTDKWHVVWIPAAEAEAEPSHLRCPHQVPHCS